MDITILSPVAQIFAGPAGRVVVPGEQGIFEILPFHRPLVSRLLPGVMAVDDQRIAIKRGVIKVQYDQIIAIIEPDSPSLPTP